MMDKAVKDKFNTFPIDVRDLLLQIRRMIFKVAEAGHIGQLTETLKWGEISYLIKGGSTVRMGWKPNTPSHIYIYFHCQTTLIKTFKEIYGEELVFEGNRAIVITVNQDIPVVELKHCISLSLRYHHIKDLPLLGV